MKTKIKAIIMSSLFIVLSFITALTYINFDDEKKDNWVYPVYAEEIHEMGACGESLEWKFDSDTGLLQISGTGNMTTYAKGSAPWYEYRGYITKISVESSVTSLSPFAFYECNNLEEIEMPFVGASRNAVGPEATFGYIFGYETRSAAEYEDYHYNSSSTKYYTYGYIYNATTYERIGQLRSDTSYKGEKLTDLNYYDWIIYSNSGSYYDKYNKSWTPTGTTFQYSCYGSPSTTSSYGYFQSYFYYIPSSIEKVTVTDANKIGAAAFRGCSNIKELNLNDDITSIGEHCFQECTSLKKTNIPTSLVDIKDYTYYNCDSLVNVECPSNLKTIGNYAYYDCGQLSSTNYSDTLVTIGNYAFYNCTSITNISFKDSLENIGSYAFSGCTSLKEIKYNDGLQTIGNYSFQNTKITSLKVPDSVVSIGTGAYKGCNNLKEIEMPFVGASRDAVGPEATFGYIFGYETRSAEEYEYYNSYSSPKYYTYGYIYNATTYERIGQLRSDTSYKGEKLTDLNYYDWIIYSNSGSYYDKYNKSWTPTGTTFQYSCYGSPSTTSSDGYFQSYFYYIPNSIEKVTVTDANKIGAAAFRGCSNIKELNLNDDITSIGDYAFWQSSIVESSNEEYVISGKTLIGYNGTSSSINIPNGVELIAPRAFYENTKINSVNLPESVWYVGANAFNGCTNALITVPKIAGSLTLGENAFKGVNSVRYTDISSHTNGNDTFYYNLNSEGNAVIVDCDTSSANITIPQELGGYKVTEIGFKGMAGCTSLIGITIPSTITLINSFAFYKCSNITTVTIPSTVKTINEHAFEDCTSLDTVTIAEGVEYIGDFAFYNCVNLSEIVVPDSALYLGKYAFYNCTSLLTATIGISVPEINEYTFYNCTSLKTVVIGIDVACIGDYAFYNCALTKVNTQNTLKIGKYAFALNKDLTRVSLKSKIETIDDGAFKGCSLLATINWPSSLSYIGSHAFEECESLTSVIIPVLVTEINDFAFASCTSLENVTINGSVTYIGNYAFYNTALVEYDFGNVLEYIGNNAFERTNLVSITLPDTVDYIGRNAFVHCSSLNYISIPDGVSFVGSYAFYYNDSNLHADIRYVSGVVSPRLFYHSSIRSVTMDDNIYEIGDYAFAYCYNLLNIHFSNELLTIGNYAFYQNREYVELTLPNKLDKIGSYAFSMNYKLNKLNIPDTVTSVGEHAFYSDYLYHPEITIEIYFVDGIVDQRLLDSQDMYHIIVDNFIHTINDNAFSNCPRLLDVIMFDTIINCGNNVFINDNNIVLEINRSLGKIEDYTFQEKLSGVNRVVINNTDIGNYAFSNNMNSYVTINGESNIGNYAFYNCVNMKRCYINGVTKIIGNHAFEECKALEKMELPDTVYSIGEYAFYNCNSMTSINIPEGVEYINSHTFFGCASLGAMTLPSSIKGIYDYAFYGCIEMDSINIPEECTFIDGYAFYNCKSLIEIIIPDSVKSIGDYAFRSCVLLTEVRLSDNVEELGECVFYDCNSLETVYLGKKIYELKDRVFYGCVNLKDIYVYAPLSYIDELAFYGADDVLVHIGHDEYMENFFNENGIMYVIDESIVYQFKVEFVNDDGTVLGVGYYNYGDTVEVPENPIKESDETYLYTFIGWDKEVTTCKGNTTYVAQYESVYIEYTVTFVDYDGIVLSSETYHYGDTVVVPSNPSRESDNIYTYEFIGWDKEVVAVTESTTYTAEYKSTYIEYEITFVDYDGNVISSEIYHYGDTVVVPSNPSRNSDETYSYTFTGWDKEVVTVTESTTYTAQYSKTYIEYEITFVDYNGNVISSETYHYGDTVIVPSNPSRNSDNTYTYEFTGWDKEVTDVTESTTYTAQYSKAYIEYEVIFVDYDGTVLSSETYHYSDTVIVPSNPSRNSDNTYTYEFIGWDKEVVAVTESTTYTAEYKLTYIEYTITFIDDDGDVLAVVTYHYGDQIQDIETPTKEPTDSAIFIFNGWDKELGIVTGDDTYIATYIAVDNEYIITFVDYDGNVISSETYHYGDTVVVPSNPSRESDETYSYTFIGWDKEVVTVTESTTYTAQYSKTYIEYEVVFKDYDGRIISSETYHYGDTIIAPSNPSRESDETYSYTFIGWDKKVGKCTGNITFKAIYEQNYIEYTVIFKDYDGRIISSETYRYGSTVDVPYDPTRESDNTYTYEFIGWDKEVTKVTKDVVYIAEYQATYIEYTVTFVDNDGNVILSQTYHYCDTIEYPENPSKESDEVYNYVFVKWDKNIKIVMSDLTITAIFEKEYREYTVEFVDYNGNVISSETYHYGDTVAAPSNPSRESDNTYSYEFSGWDKEITTVNGNVTYTAQYTEKLITSEKTKNSNLVVIISSVGGASLLTSLIFIFLKTKKKKIV